MRNACKDCEYYRKENKTCHRSPVLQKKWIGGLNNAKCM
nr:MAG TPA: hypothetical protein [Caudoviricetes sp.]